MKRHRQTYIVLSLNYIWRRARWPCGLIRHLLDRDIRGWSQEILPQEKLLLISYFQRIFDKNKTVRCISLKDCCSDPIVSPASLILSLGGPNKVFYSLKVSLKLKIKNKSCDQNGDKVPKNDVSCHICIRWLKSCFIERWKIWDSVNVFWYSWFEKIEIELPEWTCSRP